MQLKNVHLQQRKSPLEFLIKKYFPYVIPLYYERGTSREEVRNGVLLKRCSYIHIDVHIEGVKNNLCMYM